MNTACCSAERDLEAHFRTRYAMRGNNELVNSDVQGEGGQRLGVSIQIGGFVHNYSLSEFGDDKHQENQQHHRTGENKVSGQ